MLPLYKKPHTVSMNDFQGFFGKVLMAQDGTKKLEIITDVSQNMTVYSVTDADGRIYQCDTPQGAIEKYNTL